MCCLLAVLRGRDVDVLYRDTAVVINNNNNNNPICKAPECQKTSVALMSLLAVQRVL